MENMIKGIVVEIQSDTEHFKTVTDGALSMVTVVYSKSGELFVVFASCAVEPVFRVGEIVGVRDGMVHKTEGKIFGLTNDDAVYEIVCGHLTWLISKENHFRKIADEQNFSPSAKANECNADNYKKQRIILMDAIGEEYARLNPETKAKTRKRSSRYSRQTQVNCDKR